MKVASGVLRHWLIVVGCVVGCTQVPSIPEACNGSIELCERRYDEVVYATSHNSMSNEDEGWLNPNHYHGITAQLEDGVRALMLDVHAWEGGVYLCHGICELGSKPLAEGLDEIRTFLRANRGEVVTILLEPYVTPVDVEAAFDDARLADLVYTRDASGAWPTLRSLVDADSRLIILTQDGGGAYPWYLDIWDQAWDTDYAARTVDDFGCAPSRGDPDNDLFILNHFLTRALPVPEEAEQTNGSPFLLDRAMECMDAADQLPNFIAVDFYSVGSLFETVDALNQL